MNRLCDTDMDAIHEDCHDKDIECAACHAHQLLADVDSGVIGSPEVLQAKANAYAERMAVAFNTSKESAEAMMMEIIAVIVLKDQAAKMGVDVSVMAVRPGDFKPTNATIH